MDSTLSLQIMCPVCLSDFSDPVNLPCQHTFCRQCITIHLDSSPARNKCPECRQSFTAEDFTCNRALRNVVQVVQKQRKTREAVGTHQETAGNDHEMLCSEHGEQLKLFCVNDQKLVCIICKEGKLHCGHSFKPVKEAMEISENLVRGALNFICNEEKEMGAMILNQMCEIADSTERAKHLEKKLHTQFKKMHDFLRKKEENMKKQLKRAANSAKETMNKNASFLAELEENGKIQALILESGLKIRQHDRFLEWWSKEGLPLVTEMTFSKDKSALQARFRSRLDGLRVIPDHFSLGPYETVLPLLVWRDMLGSVKHGLEDISTIDKDLKLSVREHNNLQICKSEDYFAKIQKFHNGYKDNYVENLQTGQVYWEVDVGVEPGWELGLTVRYYPKENSTSLWQMLLSKQFEKIFLVVKDNRLYAGKNNNTTVIDQVVPSRVGVYLDCDRRHILFCNADNMSVIHTVWCGDM